MLAATETLRFHPGDVVLRAGERDRAFYLLLDGRLEAEGTGTRSLAPAALGVAGFLDGAAARRDAPRAHARRAGAHELGRLRGARGARPAARPDDPPRPRPRPRRAAARRRATLAGWTGRHDRLPELHADPRAPAGRRVAGDPRRHAARRHRPRHGARRRARRRPLRPVEARHPACCRCCGWSCRACGATSARSRPPTRRRACSASPRRCTAPDWLKEYGFVIAAGLFILFVSLRKVGLDDSGPASALLLLGALVGGFIGGMLLKGKSGWCSSICPLLPIQRLYGQTPVQARRQLPLHPVRRLHEVLLRLQPEGRVPGRPQRPRPVLGRLPQALRGRLPGARARLLQPARGARRRGDPVALRPARPLPRRAASRCSTRSTRC